MCDDSPAERRFWIQKMEEMRKQTEQEERALTRINVVQNWFEELKQKVPVK